MLLGAIVEGWPCAVIEGNSHDTKLVCPLSKGATGGVLDTAGEDEVCPQDLTGYLVEIK